MHQRLDQQRTGSVYLDQLQRRPARPSEPKRRSLRRVAASLCLVIGCLSAGLAATVEGLRMLVLDPAPLTDAIDETLDDPIARTELEREIAAGIERGLVGEELAAVAELYGLDVAEEANRIAATVLDDPTVRDEFRTLVADTHRHVLVDPSGPDPDLAPITAAVLAVIEVESPRLAAIVPPDATLWAFDPATLPDLSRAATLADRGLVALLAGSVLIPLGVALHPRRHRAIATLGRWLLVIGLTAGLAAVGLPYLAGNLTGYSTAEIAVRSLTIRLLAPAALSGIVGMGMVSLAAVLKAKEKARIANEGAAAALGWDEPAPWQQTTSPTLDLARRGLVDVNHPLTNI